MKLLKHNKTRIISQHYSITEFFYKLNSMLEVSHNAVKENIKVLFE